MAISYGRVIRMDDGYRKTPNKGTLVDLETGKCYKFTRPDNTTGERVREWDVKLNDIVTFTPRCRRALNVTLHQKARVKYVYHYDEFSIVDNLKQSLIRTANGDNITDWDDSSIEPLEIVSIDGNTLYLSALPEEFFVSTDQFDWFVLTLDDYNTSDPGTDGDYLTMDKIVSFNFENNSITLADATGFDVGEPVCIYSMWVNYEFLANQENYGIFNNNLSSSWRRRYINPGPVWYDDDKGRFVLLLDGRNGNDPQIGFGYSYDLVDWHIGNNDEPIITHSDHTNFALQCMAEGNVVELDDNRVAFAVMGRDASSYNHTHIVTMNRDCTEIEISDGLAEDINAYTCSLVYYKCKYYLIITNNTGGLDGWTVEMRESDSLLGPYTKKCDVIGSQYDNNKSVWLEGWCDMHCPFVERGKLYMLMGGTSRYRWSAVKANRVTGLMEYDDQTNSWKITNPYAPELIFPMYTYRILGTGYNWAGGHMGGFLTFIKWNGTCYFFCAFTSSASKYRVAAIRLVKNT